MESFIDIFINNYYLYDNGKVEFSNDYGTITFIKISNKKIVTIFEIFVNPEYRRQGIFTKFIYSTIDKCIKFNYKLLIVSVLSKILYDYLLRLKYNDNIFILTKAGFYLVKKKIKV